MNLPHLLGAAVLACGVAMVASAQVRPKGTTSALTTRPERTDYRETSRYDEVVAFMEAAARVSPLIHLTTFGYTNEGRALPLAVVGAPGATGDAVRRTGKLRVYIQGNIHAGEVEGKESSLMLLRELALGRHGDWLQRMVLLVAPIYNADGNERVALTNRGPQHGPVGGMGQRPNAQGLDLNRDHMKLESPEARSLVRLLNDYDPDVALDLHTTDGSRHAYYLTYAPPLNPATDPSIIDLLRRDFFPWLTRTIRTKYGWDFYYYGNLEGRGAPGTPEERGWKSFDHRPRFNNNYIGLRNRFALLSEAYAYATFEDRIKATSRFIEETLNFARGHSTDLRTLVEKADRRSIVGARLGLRAELTRAAEPVEILLGEVAEERNPYSGQIMYRRLDVRKPERMPEYGTFRATETERVPSAYYVPATVKDAIARLQAHGIRLARLEAPLTAEIEEFRIDSNEAASREFQNHRERTLTGAWVAARRELPAGTLKVEMTQRLARLAFYLLEPRSDDGLVDWNVLDVALAGANVFPIVRTRD